MGLGVGLFYLVGILAMIDVWSFIKVRVITHITASSIQNHHHANFTFKLTKLVVALNTSEVSSTLEPLYNITQDSKATSVNV